MLSRVDKFLSPLRMTFNVQRTFKEKVKRCLYITTVTCVYISNIIWWETFNTHQQTLNSMMLVWWCSVRSSVGSVSGPVVCQSITAASLVVRYLKTTTFICHLSTPFHPCLFTCLSVFLYLCLITSPSNTFSLLSLFTHGTKIVILLSKYNSKLIVSNQLIHYIQISWNITSFKYTHIHNSSNL